jgi:hypothetical protein
MDGMESTPTQTLSKTYAELISKARNASNSLFGKNYNLRKRSITRIESNGRPEEANNNRRKEGKPIERKGSCIAKAKNNKQKDKEIEKPIDGMVSTAGDKKNGSKGAENSDKQTDRSSDNNKQSENTHHSDDSNDLGFSNAGGSGGNGGDDGDHNRDQKRGDDISQADFDDEEVEAEDKEQELTEEVVNKVFRQEMETIARLECIKNESNLRRERVAEDERQKEAMKSLIEQTMATTFQTMITDAVKTALAPMTEQFQSFKEEIRTTLKDKSKIHDLKESAIILEERIKGYDYLTIKQQKTIDDLLRKESVDEDLIRKMVSSTEKTIKTSVTEEMRNTRTEVKESLELVVNKLLTKGSETQDKTLDQRFGDQKCYLQDIIDEKITSKGDATNAAVEEVRSLEQHIISEIDSTIERISSETVQKLRLEWFQTNEESNGQTIVDSNTEQELTSTQKPNKTNKKSNNKKSDKSEKQKETKVKKSGDNTAPNDNPGGDDPPSSSSSDESDGESSDEGSEPSTTDEEDEDNCSQSSKSSKTTKRKEKHFNRKEVKNVKLFKRGMDVKRWVADFTIKVRVADYPRHEWPVVMATVMDDTVSIDYEKFRKSNRNVIKKGHKKWWTTYRSLFVEHFRAPNEETKLLTEMKALDKNKFRNYSEFAEKGFDIIRRAHRRRVGALGREFVKHFPENMRTSYTIGDEKAYDRAPDDFIRKWSRILTSHDEISADAEPNSKQNIGRGFDNSKPINRFRPSFDNRGGGFPNRYNNNRNNNQTNGYRNNSDFSRNNSNLDQNNANNNQNNGQNSQQNTYQNYRQNSNTFDNQQKSAQNPSTSGGQQPVGRYVPFNGNQQRSDSCFNCGSKEHFYRECPKKKPNVDNNWRKPSVNQIDASDNMFEGNGSGGHQRACPPKM